jgi:thiazole biosynthesis protein thiH
MRIDHLKYLPHMEILDSQILDEVLRYRDFYDYDKFSSVDVYNALQKPTCEIYDLMALLSPAAGDFIEEMAQKAQAKKRAYFGDNIYIFTPLYIANYCDNHCVYCGFNSKNKIERLKLDESGIRAEMEAIARSGLKEILILTGESENFSDVRYIGEACKIAREYFDVIGVEIYPLNSADYAYLHECGADFVTIFQETYNHEKYEKIHLAGNKRIFPYRFYGQERALKGGMRGVGFGALLGLDDFRKDALSVCLHAYFLQQKYPHAEIALSVPRLRPIINNAKINPRDVHERELLQVICAYRIFLPFASITISTRENAKFRDNAIKIGANKISAGVSVGIGEHSAKNAKKGDEQFEISDSRDLFQVQEAILNLGLNPILREYIYV